MRLFLKPAFCLVLAAWGTLAGAERVEAFGRASVEEERRVRRQPDLWRKGRRTGRDTAIY